MNQVNIGKFIAEKRKEKGYTQQQLADMLLVSNRSVSRWENGLNMPDLSLLEPLCEILGITLTQLLQGGDNVEEKPEETLKGVVQYSDKMLARKKKSLRIVLIAMGMVLSFGAGYLLSQYLSWQKPLTVSDHEQPYAFLSREDLISMTMYNHQTPNKVKLPREEAEKVFNQLRTLKMDKLIPADLSYDRLFNNHMTVVTRKGTFTFAVAPNYLELENRYYISPYVHWNKEAAPLMNYLNFAEVVNSFESQGYEDFDVQEYENLDDSNGLILAIWKTIGAEVRCGLFADSGQIAEAVILTHKGISLELMRTVLENYDPEKIEIKLVQNMISSNSESYWKDPNDPEMISFFRDLLFR